MDTTSGVVFLGIIVSLIITVIKNKYKIGTSGSMALVVVMALVSSVGYVAISHFGYWEIFWKIITIAGAFYAYVIKNIKDAKPNNSEV